jgi:hypothetical protein
VARLDAGDSVSYIKEALERIRKPKVGASAGLITKCRMKWSELKTQVFSA